MTTTEKLARELQAVWDNPHGGYSIENWRRVAARVEAMQKPLREALEKYGVHEDYCGCNLQWDQDDTTCTCGFDTAQQLLKPKK